VSFTRLAPPSTLQLGRPQLRAVNSKRKFTIRGFACGVDDDETESDREAVESVEASRRRDLEILGCSACGGQEGSSRIVKHCRSEIGRIARLAV
jgi:hypothetical protein